jgi:hypothetical protein
MKTTKKVNSLKTTLVKTKDDKDYIINIMLADECKNGHNDFSITGKVYPVGKREDRNIITAGAIGDTIAKVFPELAIFNDLHLCNVNGVPMYALVNGMYHIKNEPQHIKSHFNATDKEVEILKTAEDEQVLCYMLVTMGIVKRWKETANKAIKILEEMTGESFEDNSTRLESVELTPKRKAEIQALIDAGHYTPEQIEARKLEANEVKRKDELQKLENDFNKKIESERLDYLANKAVLLGGLSNKNFIYYTHTNEGVFNWNTSAYNKAVTIEQFDGFMKWIALEKPELPKGIIFKLGK